MRIAALADIHGNLQAFEAALEHVRTQHVDQTVLCGDITVGCADDLACWHLARESDCAAVRGNAERYLADFGTERADPRWTTELFRPLQWSVAHFPEAARRELADLPLTYSAPGHPELVFCHGSPRSDGDQIKAYTPGESLTPMFEGCAARYIVRGHNHIPGIRLWEGRTIVTCGSTGLQVDFNPEAQYAVLEQRNSAWHVTHHAVAYDVEGALRRFEETGYLPDAGPMGRLFARAVATATNQIMPFFRYYRRWQAEEDIGLAEAVERFLRLY